MVRRFFLFAAIAVLAGGLIPAEAARRPHQPPPPPPGGEDPGDPGVSPASACGGLDSAEVTGLLNGAVTAVDFPTLAVAVVDRPGNVIGLWLRGSPSLAQQDEA